MLRHHRATVLLALSALLGHGGPAKARSARAADEASPAAPGSAPGFAPAVLPAPAMAVPIAAAPAPEAIDPWVARIDARLAAVEADRRARPSTSSAPDDALSQTLADIAKRAPSKASVGIAVRSLETGAPVFEWHPDRAINPASNQKLLTAAAALELLGADYRFDTHVRRSGDTLVLVGETRGVGLDGDTLVVGAWLADNAVGINAGAAYVYERDEMGRWRGTLHSREQIRGTVSMWNGRVGTPGGGRTGGLIPGLRRARCGV